MAKKRTITSKDFLSKPKKPVAPKKKVTVRKNDLKVPSAESLLKDGYTYLKDKGSRAIYVKDHARVSVEK